MGKNMNHQIRPGNDSILRHRSQPARVQQPVETGEGEGESHRRHQRQPLLWLLHRTVERNSANLAGYSRIIMIYHDSCSMYIDMGSGLECIDFLLISKYFKSITPIRGTNDCGAAHTASCSHQIQAHFEQKLDHSFGLFHFAIPKTDRSAAVSLEKTLPGPGYVDACGKWLGLCRVPIQRSKGSSMYHFTYIGIGKWCWIHIWSMHV